MIEFLCFFYYIQNVGVCWMASISAPVEAYKEVVDSLSCMDIYTVGTLNPDFDKNMLLLKNPQYLPDHYETLTQ